LEVNRRGSILSAADARGGLPWAYLAFALAWIVFGLKLVAYRWTGSVVVLSDALEGLVNIAAGAFALFAVSLAQQPPDDNHPYGHGKVEFLSAAIEGGLVVGAACVIAYEALLDLVRGPGIDAVRGGSVLLLASAAVNGTIGWALVRAGRRVGSVALEADGRHLLTDVVTSILAILALLLVSATGLAVLDPLIALGASLLVARTGVRLLRRAVGGMMDEADPDDLRLLRRALAEIDEPLVRGYRGLRSRHQGKLHQVDVALLIDSSISVGTAAAVARRVAQALKGALGAAAVSCRVEPWRGDPTSEAPEVSLGPE